MPTDEAITERYVRHALTLIRVSNSYVYQANRDLRKLALLLRKIFIGEDLAELGLRKLRALITEADAAIGDTFLAIGERQDAATKELINIEAKWAKEVGKYDATASDAAIARANSNFVVMGNTTDEHFDSLAARLQRQVRAQVRLGAQAGQTDKEIVARIVGEGSDMRGGVLEQTKRETRGIVDAATQSAADAGRRAAMKANGVNLLRWFAILDTHVCPNCAIRADKVWTIDGEPIANPIPYAPVPLHPVCRCLYLPLKVPAAIVAAGLPPSKKFDEWFKSLDRSEQEDIFGVGRTELWLSGKITLQDLIGQNGLVLNLRDLHARL